MTRIEAVYADGVFHPIDALPYADQQRVRLTIEPANGPTLPRMATTQDSLDKAFDELMAAVDADNLQLRVRMPTRDEMHERH